MGGVEGRNEAGEVCSWVRSEKQGVRYQIWEESEGWDSALFLGLDLLLSRFLMLLCSTLRDA